LFEPFGEVTEHGGEVFLKVDSLSQPSFAEAGSSPFIYVARGKPMPTSYWRLPASAHDEADELRRCGPRSGSRRRAAPRE
jgi:TfoX/Sxy family transcriptional regulator of competence genes